MSTAIRAQDAATRHIRVRPALERGRTNLGWLDSRHSFAFGGYHDRAHLGFRSLRVINDDRVAAGGGFDSHPHSDMEIFSYVLDGALTHRDSMGTSRTLRPGELQLMSAGTGVVHSERNPSQVEGTHFLQVWIQPEQEGLEPRYTEWMPDDAGAGASKVLMISRDGRQGSAVIRQDADVYRVRLGSGDTVAHDLRPGRGAWLQVIEGEIELDGVVLGPGDGASTARGDTLSLRALSDVHALLFDLG